MRKKKAVKSDSGANPKARKENNRRNVENIPEKKKSGVWDIIRKA